MVFKNNLESKITQWEGASLFKNALNKIHVARFRTDMPFYMCRRIVIRLHPGYYEQPDKLATTLHYYVGIVNLSSHKFRSTNKPVNITPQSEFTSS